MLRPDLSKILNAELLGKVHDLQFPWSKDSRLDFDEVGYHLFVGESDNDDLWKETCLETAIRPIISIGFDNLPNDFLQFLPRPDSSSFPMLAFSLILLFDQAPEHVLSGKDREYIKPYFRPMALRLCHQLLTLPEELRPWRIERWLDLGWSFEHAIIRQVFYFAPFVHSGDIDDQAIQHGLVENYRCEVERRVGKIDSNRSTAGSDAQDTTLLEKLISDGPPKGNNVKMEDYVFWTARVMDAHLPIIRKLKRNPATAPRS